ncbi:MAG TPA: hypothetical protein VK192_00905 [Sphingomicrobium sp.]|jgi:hypothetical protein|nr:hypothetical protein [Sphingomicrobium sp.]
MDHEWLPQTPEELRRQADKFEKLAAFVSRGDVAQHLKEQAAQLIAEAELRSLSAR